MLMAASTACSDHCPLFLAVVAALRCPARFRFEAFWPRFPLFHETVDRAWGRPTVHPCAFVRLKIKLARTRRGLKIWSGTLFSEARLQLHIVTEVVLHLDIAQESRRLSTAEFNMRKLLKQRILGLAMID